MNTFARTSARVCRINLKTVSYLACALLAMHSCVPGASAATVTFTLDLSEDNVWKVYAAVSQGDNFGLARYGFKFIGSTLTHDNTSPRSTSPSAPMDGLGAGFSLLRSADDTDAGVETNISISASQDTVGSIPNPHLIYGFGQEASSFAAEGVTPGGTIEGNPWANPLLLAQGTYNRSAGPLAIDTTSVLTFAGVFIEADDPNDNENPATAAVLSEVFVTIPYVPEPTSAAVFGLGILGLTATFRRFRPRNSA
jgi:hypothetical protein